MLPQAAFQLVTGFIFEKKPFLAAFKNAKNSHSQNIHKSGNHNTSSQRCKKPHKAWQRDDFSMQTACPAHKP